MLVFSLRALVSASLAAFFVGACSGANDSGSNGGGDSGGDTGGIDGIPVGTCHLSMFHQASTNMKAVTMDLGAADFADLRCDAGASVCVVGTHPATSGTDAVTFSFSLPKTGDGQTFGLTGPTRLEIVQQDGTQTDSWTSTHGRVTFVEVSAASTSFSLVEIGMDPESISNNGATGTYLVNMDCHGLTIAGI